MSSLDGMEWGVDKRFLDPVVIRAVSLKEMGLPLSERLQEFPWMLSDLIFPFMGEYLVRLMGNAATEISTNKPTSLRGS